ncbi:MAG: hypothetical protein AB7R89_03375 [Dehalococcoidia bacterium]
MRRLMLLASMLIVGLSLNVRLLNAAPTDLDPTFGQGGVATITPPLNGTGGPVRIITQSDGKIFAISQAGWMYRVQGDGAPDTTFGSMQHGVAALALPPDTTLFGVTIVDAFLDNNGAYVIVFQGICGNVSCLAILRYTRFGILDTLFGSSGAIYYQNSIASGAMMQPDGKIVVAIRTQDPLQSFRHVAYLIRFNVDGSIDNSFGSSGLVEFASDPTTSVTTFVVAIQPDGKIVSAGDFNTGGLQNILRIRRYNSSGSVDNLFGVNQSGAIDIPVSSSEAFTGPYVRAILIDSTEGLTIAGRVNDRLDGNSRVLLVQLTPLGTPVSTYGTSGVILGSSFQPAPFDFAIDTNNKVVLTTFIQTSNNAGDIVSIRYLHSGQVDTEFAAGGVVRTSIGIEGHGSHAAISIQPDTKIVVGAEGTAFTLVRYVGSSAAGPTGARLDFTQLPSSTATAGQPFAQQPKVTVRDASGNPVTSYSGTVTLAKAPSSTGPGNLTCTGGPGPNQQTVVNGVASFAGCAFDQPGTYLLRATSGTLAAADSTAVTVTGTAPLTKVAAVEPLPLGQAQTWTITATNPGSTPTSSVTVTDVLPSQYRNLQVRSSGWSCNSSSQTTNNQTTSRVTCTWRTPLAPGASTAPITIQAVAATCGTAPIPNTASVSFAYAGMSAPTTATASAMTTITCSGTPTPNPSASPPPSQRRYAAGGDSIPFGADLSESVRTGQNYPSQLLNNHLATLNFSSTAFLNTAQSGASSTNYVSGGGSFTRQLDPTVAHRPDLITMTLGVDNKVLPSLVEQCLPLLQAFDIAATVACENTILNDEAAWNTLITDLQVIFSRYLQLMQENRQLLVAVTNYYNPLPRRLTDDTIRALCDQLQAGFSGRCREQLNELSPAFIGANAVIERLNRTIEGMVRRFTPFAGGRFVFVDLYRSFIGHCTSINATIAVTPAGGNASGNLGCSESWIEPAFPIQGSKQIPITVAGQQVVTFTVALMGQAGVHPNAAGHRCIAALIWEATKARLGSSEPAKQPCA